MNKEKLLTSQLVELSELANKNGLYDAASYIKNIIGEEKIIHKKTLNDMLWLLSHAFYIGEAPKYGNKGGWVEYRFAVEGATNHKAVMNYYGWSVGEFREFFSDRKHDSIISFKDKYCFAYIPNLFGVNI